MYLHLDRRVLSIPPERGVIANISFRRPSAVHMVSVPAFYVCEGKQMRLAVNLFTKELEYFLEEENSPFFCFIPAFLRIRRIIADSLNFGIAYKQTCLLFLKSKLVGLHPSHKRPPPTFSSQ